MKDGKKPHSEDTVKLRQTNESCEKKKREWRKSPYSVC